MIRRYVIRVLERMPPALMSLIALAVALWTPGFSLAAADASTGQGVRWYDPSDWFERGGNLPHESQWYLDTYGHGGIEPVPPHPPQGAQGYYPRMEKKMQPGDRQMAEYEGQILDVRTAWFRDPKAPLQVFARVHLDSGITTAVDLGPRNQLSDIDLGGLRGKRIALLAHSATIAGEKALVAHQIRLYGRTTRISWSVQP